VPVRAALPSLAALAAWLLAPAAAGAQGKDEEGEEAEEEGGEAEESSEEAVVVDDAKPAPKPKQEEFKKQDLRGHAVEASSATSPFEKDRFFADKVDTKKTADGTLVQGSIASSSFIYRESAGNLGGDANLGSAASKFDRMFTELRLQTDFRHIGGGKWDARIDTRARAVSDPRSTSDYSVTPSRIQSGFNGHNEYEVREAWLVRSGKRSDLFFGRQFISDLGALRIDGLRVDYAQSEKLTLIGFGGLYPVRGSRSITTDYVALKDDTGSSAGRLVGSGGFGLAYRTLNAHGALGGVAIVPFSISAETPRIYATSNGYYRGGAKLDLYHMAIVDVLGEAAPALTNLSAGLNYKPSQRLRITGSFNRVDTETLNVQANAFLRPEEQTGGGNVIQNETFIKRLSTNAGKLGVSAGLGSLQRFELSTAVNFRYRPAFTLQSPDGLSNVNLPAAQGVDVYLGFVDRQSIADLRLGADVSRSFAAGSVAYQRSEVLAARVFAGRELSRGRGEWEAELGYSTTKDTAGGTACMTPADCFGTSNGTMLSIGGNLYYRISSDWFALGNLWVTRNAVQASAPMAVNDPAILGLTGYARIAYRF
jgi:hypothetical protein